MGYESLSEAEKYKTTGPSGSLLPSLPHILAGKTRRKVGEAGILDLQTAAWSLCASMPHGVPQSQRWKCQVAELFQCWGRGCGDGVMATGTASQSEKHLEWVVRPLVLEPAREVGVSTLFLALSFQAKTSSRKGRQVC